MMCGFKFHIPTNFSNGEMAEQNMVEAKRDVSTQIHNPGVVMFCKFQKITQTHINRLNRKWHTPTSTAKNMGGVVPWTLHPKPFLTSLVYFCLKKVVRGQLSTIEH